MQNGTSYNVIDSTIPGSQLGGLAWGDYDGDGDFDAAAAGTGLGTAFIFSETISRRNPTDRSRPSNYRRSNLATAPLVLWADLNNDGLLDLVVAGGDQTSSPSTPRLLVFVQKPDHTFNDAQVLPDPNSPREVGFKNASLAVSDINMDGRPDLDASPATQKTVRKFLSC